MKAMLNLLKYEQKIFMREFFAWFFTIVFPIIMFLIFGSTYGNEQLIEGSSFKVIDAFVPMLMILGMLVTGTNSLPNFIAEYRETKILKRYKMTPISPIFVLIANMINLFIMTVISSLLILVTGKLVFSTTFNASIFQVILAYIICLFSMFSIGLLIASVCPTTKVAMIVSNIVYFIMIFLSGITVPVEFMGDIIGKIAKLVPAYYAGNLFKGVWLNGSIMDYTNEIIILLIIFLVSFVVSIKIFKWE